MNLIFSTFAIAAILTVRAAAERIGLRGKQPHLFSQAAAPNPEVFEAAISLEDFRNVDPEKFEWVNPVEIQAGETTCGFLKAPLVWEIEDMEIVYPIVRTCAYHLRAYRMIICLLLVSNLIFLSCIFALSFIDVCVTFATQQPAPRGNMAVHCGGPGGLSLCNYKIWLDLDEEARCKSTCPIV